MLYRARHPARDLRQALRGYMTAGCVLAALSASACGGSRSSAPAPAPSAAAEQAVAGRFAVALRRGDVAHARSLLVQPDEPALVFLIRRVASRWRGLHVSLALPPRRAAQHWITRFSGARTFRDGRFERESGDLVLLLGPSPTGARVTYFLLAHLRTSFSTHHDSALLPSKR
jgi:hypothetical protein